MKADYHHDQLCTADWMFEGLSIWVCCLLTMGLAPQAGLMTRFLIAWLSRNYTRRAAIVWYWKHCKLCSCKDRQHLADSEPMITFLVKHALDSTGSTTYTLMICSLSLLAHFLLQYAVLFCAFVAFHSFLFCHAVHNLAAETSKFNMWAWTALLALCVFVVMTVNASIQTDNSFKSKPLQVVSHSSHRLKYLCAPSTAASLTFLNDVEPWKYSYSICQLNWTTEISLLCRVLCEDNKQ